MMDERSLSPLLQDSTLLAEHIRSRFKELGLDHIRMDLPDLRRSSASAVLFILSGCRPEEGGSPEPCVILNKRSAQVRQAGDLCCPGGGISWRMDRLLGRLLDLPKSPLNRRPGPGLRPPHGVLNLLLAAGLRESWEEMRLNPLRFTFLGRLPQQELVMFERVIYPLVGWASPQPLRPNWEVERVVHIPLRRLLDPRCYGRFRPMVAAGRGKSGTQPLRYQDFPCFIHQDRHGREMLWGATYRITQSFLELTFGFTPPAMEELPLAERHLDEAYLNGSRWRPRSAQRSDKADW